MVSPNEDYYAWTQETIEKLRQGRLSEVNMEDLIEELEDIGRNERRALESRLSVLLAHLLKWQYQPKERSYSWEGTIGEQREKTQVLLEDNPSLKPELPLFVERAYKTGIKTAMKETNMPVTTFPPTFEQTGWSWEQVLDSEFYPD